MEYKTIHLNKDELKSLTKLQNQSFPKKRSIDYIYNKYDMSNFGVKPLGLFSIDKDEKPVAYYGVFPIQLKYDNKLIWVAQSGDTMTHPNHRGKGLFMELAKSTYEICSQNQIELIFGFPNSQSYPGFIRLGWTFTGKWQHISFRRKPFFIFKLLHRIPLFKSYFINRLREDATVYEKSNWQEYLPDGVKGYIHKNEAYFDYKTKCSGAQIIEFEGFKLFLKIDSNLIIGDVSYFEAKRTTDFINCIKKLSKKYWCEGVIFQFSKNHWIYDYLKASNIIPQESNSAGNIGGIVLLDSNKINVDKIMFVLGDTDFF